MVKSRTRWLCRYDANTITCNTMKYKSRLAKHLTCLWFLLNKSLCCWFQDNKMETHIGLTRLLVKICHFDIYFFLYYHSHLMFDYSKFLLSSILLVVALMIFSFYLFAYAFIVNKIMKWRQNYQYCSLQVKSILENLNKQ